MQRVTQEFLALGVDDDISDNQLILLDVARENWREDALWKNISDARAELFVLLKGISAKTNQEKIIENYKALQGFRKQVPGSLEVNMTSEVSSEDITIYCDGGCSPNPGESGSGISVYRGEKPVELWYGLYEEMGTNNTAELHALYNALLIAEKESEKGHKVEIKCDSMYAINCIKTWAISWEKNGWKKKGGEIKNLEIIQRAYSLYNTLSSRVKLTHVKAHNGEEGNELADRMTHHSRETQERAFIKLDSPLEIKAWLEKV